MNKDNHIADIILGALEHSKYLVKQFVLEYAVLRDNPNRDKEKIYTKIDFSRVIEHLVKEGYIIKEFNNRTDEDFYYGLTFKGKHYYLTGGFLPNKWQKIKRWVKNDTAYGNAKWIITIILTVISITLAIIAILKK